MSRKHFYFGGLFLAAMAIAACGGEDSSDEGSGGGGNPSPAAQYYLVTCDFDDYSYPKGYDLEGRPLEGETETATGEGSQFSVCVPGDVGDVQTAATEACQKVVDEVCTGAEVDYVCEIRNLTAIVPEGTVDSCQGTSPSGAAYHAVVEPADETPCEDESYTIREYQYSAVSGSLAEQPSPVSATNVLGLGYVGETLTYAKSKCVGAGAPSAFIVRGGTESPVGGDNGRIVSKGSGKTKFDLFATDGSTAWIALPASVVENDVVNPFETYDAPPSEVFLVNTTNGVLSNLEEAGEGIVEIVPDLTSTGRSVRTTAGVDGVVFSESLILEQGSVRKVRRTGAKPYAAVGTSESSSLIELSAGSWNLTSTVVPGQVNEFLIASGNVLVSYEDTAEEGRLDRYVGDVGTGNPLSGAWSPMLMLRDESVAFGWQESGGSFGVFGAVSAAFPTNGELAGATRRSEAPIVCVVSAGGRLACLFEGS